MGEDNTGEHPQMPTNGYVLIPDTSFFVALSQQSLWTLPPVKWLSSYDGSIILPSKVEREFNYQKSHSRTDKFGVPFFGEEEKLEDLIDRPIHLVSPFVSTEFSSRIDKELEQHTAVRKKKITFTDKNVVQAALDHLASNPRGAERMFIAFADRDILEEIKMIYRTTGVELMYFSPFSPSLESIASSMESPAIALEGVFGKLYSGHANGTHPYALVKRNVGIREHLTADILCDVAFLNLGYALPKEKDVSLVPIIRGENPSAKEEKKSLPGSILGKREAFLYFSCNPNYLWHFRHSSPLAPHEIARIASGRPIDDRLMGRYAQAIDTKNISISLVPRIDEWHLHELDSLAHASAQRAKRQYSN